MKTLPKVGIRGTLIAVMALLGAGCGDAPESSSPSFPEKRANQELGEAILADAREVASDHGISVEEAAAAIERQPLVGRLQQALATRGSASFGGLFIEYQPEYQIVLLALPGGADEVTRAVDELGFAELSPFVIVRETPYTEDVLKDAMRMVSDLGRAKLTSLDLDIRTGEILATAASPADVAAIHAAVDAADPPVPARRVVVSVPRGEGAQAGEAIAEDTVISVHPPRVRAGSRAQLRVERSRAGWGLPWVLERAEGAAWEWVGNLKAGPGRQWKAEFSIGHTGGMYEDIGFSGPASIDLKIPKLESGRYRLGQEFIRPGRDPLEDRLVWHYTEFEVIE